MGQIYRRLIALLAITFTSWVNSAEPHIVYFLDSFPPYYYLDETNQPAGLVVEVANKALTQSGIDFQLEGLNGNRILRNIQEGGNISAIGLYKTPEREQYAIMRPEIYRPPPPVLIVKKSALEKFPQPLSTETFKNLVESSKITGVLVSSYSYGAWADKLIQNELKSVEKLDITMIQALKMIASPLRADFTLAYPDQAKHLINSDEAFAEKFAFIKLDDAPLENTGIYWMFAKDCDPKIIAIIEQSMNQVRASSYYQEVVKRYTEL